MVVAGAIEVDAPSSRRWPTVATPAGFESTPGLRNNSHVFFFIETGSTLPFSLSLKSPKPALKCRLLQ